MNTPHPLLARVGALVALFALAALPCAAGDFADSVAGYFPAPGQFINSALFNDPTRALGPPVGGGTISPDNSKLVSLGGFGGSITLRYSPPLPDHPCNPYGLDLIVFGNTSWVSGNPNRRFAEAGTIEVSRDWNNNGLPDDPWYVIRGSHLPATPNAALQSQLWDNSAGTATPPANLSWYPGAPAFPAWPSSYATTTFRLPALFEAMVIVNPNGTAATTEGYHGYADCTPTLLLGDTDSDNLVDAPGLTPGEFFTTPDNPFAVGISPGSGGGDAVDLAWAVDPATGEPARLDRADFVRVSTGVNFLAGVLGELSVEISAAAKVRPNPALFDLTGDSIPDPEDLYAWHSVAPTRRDLTGEGLIDPADANLLTRSVRCTDTADLEAQR